MVTIRNWRAATPVVAHDNVLRWTIMEQQGTPDFPPELAPLHTISGVAIHMMSPGKQAEGHGHDDIEQLYYFTRGCGKMRLDDQVYPVREGDTAHVPPGVEHQLVNDGDDWLEHLILNAPGGTAGTQPAVRNWRDCPPTVGHESAIIWSIFRHRDAPGLPPEEARMAGLTGFTLHLMQGRRNGDYHHHEDAEQVYYFTRGHGQMKIDGQLYEVREGDVVHTPARIKHQLLNTTDDWIEHLIITAKVGSPAVRQGVVEVGDLRIDPARYEVTVAGIEVKLRKKEFELLLEFCQQVGMVLTREALLSSVWSSSDSGDSRTVDVHVTWLRRKIYGSTARIETVRGVGYKLVGPA